MCAHRVDLYTQVSLLTPLPKPSTLLFSSHRPWACEGATVMNQEI